MNLEVFDSVRSKWSEELFGPVSERGPLGPLNHLQKEVSEAIAALGTPEFAEELADCLILILDAIQRSGFKLRDIERSSWLKIIKNRFDRTWPDWRQVDAAAPLEHVEKKPYKYPSGYRWFLGRDDDNDNDKDELVPDVFRKVGALLYKTEQEAMEALERAQNAAN